MTTKKGRRKIDGKFGASLAAVPGGGSFGLAPALGTFITHCRVSGTYLPPLYSTAYIKVITNMVLSLPQKVEAGHDVNNLTHTTTAQECLFLSMSATRHTIRYGLRFIQV